MNRLVSDRLMTVCGGPFSFEVAAGECVALSGPSGCGKTLLLRALADLDPAEGDVLLDAVSRDAVTAPEWRRQVGWLPAEAAWWFDVVGDHFGDQPSSPTASPSHRRSEVRDQNVRILEKLGFGEDVLDWRIERLSTGEKQRLSLFRLLMNEPKVLLLDEPTAALDPVNVGLVETVLSDYRKASGAAILWVSHSPEQIARVADRHLELWKEPS